MNKLLEWIKSNKQKRFESPREKFFGRKTSSFLINSITENSIYLKFIPSGTSLQLEFWRFEEAIKFLLESGDVMKIGARIKTKKSISPSFSLEEHLNEKATEMYKRKSDTKTAPHICDLLVLSGIAEYLWTESDIGRRVQGIKLKS